VANLPIQERLLHYFLAMGAQRVENAGIPHCNLAFVSGSEMIHVVLLNNDDITERNRIIEAVFSLASLRSSSNLLYLAAPRILGPSIDVAIFRPHGIGLLLFDERRIDEAIHPQPIQPSKPVTQGSNVDVGISAELATLKSMYAEMERTIANLREDLKTHNSEPEVREDRPERISPSRLPSEPVFIQRGLPDSALPSFFANNPWLDVLSRRGRSEGEPIAG
jgi:hypothetical protein